MRSHQMLPHQNMLRVKPSNLLASVETEALHEAKTPGFCEGETVPQGPAERIPIAGRDGVKCVASRYHLESLKTLPS